MQTKNLILVYTYTLLSVAFVSSHDCLIVWNYYILYPMKKIDCWLGITHRKNVNLSVCALSFSSEYSKIHSLGWAGVWCIFIKAEGYSVEYCACFLPSIFIKGDHPWHRYREGQRRKEQSYRRVFLFIPVKWSQRKGKIYPRNIF